MMDNTGKKSQRANDARVLVVDDHHDHAEGLADLLRLHGYEVRTASNGELAMTVVAEFEPRHVIMDVHMPSMDGNELAAMLRTYFGDDLALIGMSGSPASDAKVGLAAAMVDHYFQKPLDPALLLAVLSPLEDRANATCT